MKPNQYEKKFESKVTAKGTELPLMNLKGKAYLQVAHRLVWFREEHPYGQILTQVEVKDNACIARATISLIVNNVLQVVATGHKQESQDNFGDFMEKAETGAVGRALAMLGYGTQFEPELDEGERIVDSPLKLVGGGDGESSESNSGPQAGRQPAAVGQRQAKEANADSVAGAGEVSPSEDALPENREQLNKLIVSTAKILNSRKIRTFDQIKTEMKEKYGTDDKEQLTDAQAKELYANLKKVM